MSIAPTKCFTAWKSWPGQEARLGQIVHTPSSGLTVGVPQAGHLAGGSGLGRRFFGRCALAVGETTWGITSPARITITSSPSRTSLRRRSSSLWSVASFTVTPETWTGSSWANGIMWPVRPTFQATRSSTVVAVLGRELPGDRAARLAAHHAEPALQLEVVDLHDHAVDLEVEPVAPVLPGAAGRHDRVEVVVHLDVGVHAEAVLAQPLERLRTARRTPPPRGRRSRRPTSTAAARPSSFGSSWRIEPAAELRGLANVGSPGLGALLVQAGERGEREVDLSAHLQQRRRVLDPQRDGADRAQVLGHLLAHLAVAAGGAAHEHAVLVDERDRQAVDLRLGHEADLAELDALALEVALAAHAPTPSAPPRCGRSPARASAGGGAPARTCRAAPRPPAGSASRASSRSGCSASRSRSSFSSASYSASETSGSSRT